LDSGSPIEACAYFETAMKQPVSVHFPKKQRHECLFEFAKATFQCQDWTLSIDAIERYASKAPLTNPLQMYQAKVIHAKCLICTQNIGSAIELLSSVTEDTETPNDIYDEAYLMQITANVMSNNYQRAYDDLISIPPDVSHSMSNYIIGLKLYCLVELQKHEEAHEIGLLFDPSVVSFAPEIINLKEIFLFYMGVACVAIRKKQQAKLNLEQYLSTPSCTSDMEKLIITHIFLGQLELDLIEHVALDQVDTVQQKAFVHFREAFNSLIQNKPELLPILFDSIVSQYTALCIKLNRPITATKALSSVRNIDICREKVERTPSLLAHFDKIQTDARSLLETGFASLDEVSELYITT